MSSFKKIFHFFRSLRPLAGRRPETDWEILLSLCIVTIVVFLGLSLHLYFSVLSEPVATRPATETVLHPIEQDKLDQVLTSFAERANAFSTLQNAAPSTVDPSL